MPDKPCFVPKARCKREKIRLTWIRLTKHTSTNIRLTAAMSGVFYALHGYYGQIGFSRPLKGQGH